MNRTIHQTQLLESKNKTINFVMDEIDSYAKKSIFSFHTYKYVLTTLILIIAVVIVGLTQTNNPTIPNTGVVLGHYESQRIAEVSYISGSLISHSFTVSNRMFLSDLEESEFEGNIQEFNLYFDMLQAFLNDGNFEDQITVTELEESEYITQITFMEDNQEFIIHLNQTEEVIEGVLITNGQTFELIGTLKETETELQIKLKASNGNDYIEIEYKIESDDEIERKYEIKQNINGIYKEKEIKVEFGETETKVEITENEDSYELKSEVEEGQLVYKLEYKIGESEGEVTIIPFEDEFGNITYQYIIDEGDYHKEIELEDPDEEEEDESEDTSSPLQKKYQENKI